LSELPKGCGIRVGLDDVARSDNVLEAIALSDLSALLALATNDKNSLVFVSHLPHWGVTANELTRRDLDLHLLAELNATFLLGLATTVGNENVGAANDQ
jgi:hypothetical protein